MPTKIFVNMQVSDLHRSKVFFEKLGWSFNPQFTDNAAACLVISDIIYCMLHTATSLARFLPPGKSVTDATKCTEVVLAISTDSKESVNTMADTALANGATVCRSPEDHGFMYDRAINDLDGHIWEIFWMDPTTLKQ